MKRPERRQAKENDSVGEMIRNSEYNQAYDKWEAYYKQEIKKLELRLRLSEGREEKLCPDHCGKSLGDKTGCIACDVEYFTRKRLEIDNGKK